MIDISNLRTETHGEWTRLVADITSDFQREDREDTIWIAVKNENADMLTTDVYNMFLFYPLYMAMYYKSDLHLHGNVSRQLYQNITTYLQPIMCSFSDDLKRVNVIVDGYAEAEGSHHMIGSSFSGGVDCLSAIYNHYYKEQHEGSKINALFMIIDYDGDEDVRNVFLQLSGKLRKAAAEMKLPLYEIDTNIKVFLHHLVDRCSFFCIYSCAFAFEKVLKKYYIGSGLSYAETLKWAAHYRDEDWAGYSDPYAIPLMESERLKLVIDGCQYTRREKVELISDWDIAQRYLYVCAGKKSTSNCGECTKCRRTLLCLDAMGKLEAFSGVFDLEKYRKHAEEYKCSMVLANKRDLFATDNYQYFVQKGIKLPSWFSARVRTLPKAVMKRLKKG